MRCGGGLAGVRPDEDERRECGEDAEHEDDGDGGVGGVYPCGDTIYGTDISVGGAKQGKRRGIR